ncbi:MAG: DUF3108 domain-containing protein [Acidobacteriota bacterium]
MKSVIFKTITLAALIAALTVVSFAQLSNGHTALPGAVFAGETLKYDGKLNKILRGLSIAELTFTASTAGSEANQLVIKTEAVSKGTLLKLFRYSFLQQYQSTIDLAGFKVLRTTKHDVQKERVRDGEAVFDQKEKRVTYVETDPKDVNRPPRRIASEIGDSVQDMISGIYLLRLSQLVVGKRFDVSVSDSGLVYTVPVVVAAREQQKTVLGNVWCFRLEPQIFGPKRLIERDGKMEIWMTEDARRIPVRARINTEYGTIDVKLKSVTKPS